MNSIRPITRDIYRSKDFLFLLTEAYNRGFISLRFALNMTESVGQKTRVQLSPDFTSLQSLQAAESRLRDISTPYKPRCVEFCAEIERALDRHENSHAL